MSRKATRLLERSSLYRRFVAEREEISGWKGYLARVASKLRGPLGDPAAARLPTGETYSNE